MKPFFILIFFIIFSNCFAISEANYELEFKYSVFPFIQSLKSDFFDSHDGIKLHFLKDNNNEFQNCLIILPGQSESAIQYGELAYDLKKSSFGIRTKIFILDLRGQGLSERTASPMDMGHVDYFSDYTKDLEYFFDLVIDSNQCQQKYLFAHSMGAGIAVSYLAHHPDYFNAVVLSSPMLKVSTKPFPYLLVESIVLEEILRGRSAKFAVGQSPFNPYETFEENDYTNSKVRHQMMMDLYNLYPETKVGGLSNRWVFEVMKETRARRKFYKLITTPIRLFRAGQESTVVPNEMKRFCKEAKNCEEVYLSKARHAIFNDQDQVRTKAINSAIDFFQSN